MTQRVPWLRTAHRAHTLLTIVVVGTLLTLRLSGALSTAMAGRLLLLIEVPLLVVFAAVTVLRFSRQGPRTAGVGLLDRMETEEPLLRPVITELRAMGSLGMAMVGRRHIPPGAMPFGYTKGTMSVPTVLIVVSLIELLVVHVLVPWDWMRITLLVFTVWGVLFVLGFFATRTVNPHFIVDDALHLRWGYRIVLETPLTNVVSAVRQANHAHTQPHVEGGRLILTQFQSANLLIRLSEPVAAVAPVANVTNFHASEVQLYVDDPDGFLRAVGPTSDGVP